MKSRSIASFVAGIALAMSAFVVPSASAEESSEGIPVTESEEAALRAFMTEYGVEVSTQEGLLDKLSEGELWDSVIGGTPTSSSSTTEGTYEITIDTFADGSIKVSKIEIPLEEAEFEPGSVMPRGVSGCVATINNSYQKKYEGCEVSATSGVISMWFEVGYSIYNGAPSKINYASGKYAQVVGGTMSNQSLSITRKTQNGALPATARFQMRAKYQVKGQPIVDSNCWVQFNVKGSSRYTTDFI